MNRYVTIVLLILAPTLMVPNRMTAQSSRSSPAIEQLYRESLAAIETENYLQATQLLTRLVNSPAHVHSREAQELLGNVREANGQLAHAVAEYEAYLGKYPDGPGAERVQRRLNSILGGAAPVQKDPEVSENRVRQPATGPNTQLPRSEPVRTSYGREGQSGVDGADPDQRTMTSRGAARLVYRYNEGSNEFTELRPDGIPGISEKDDDVFDNALSLALRYTRTYDDRNKRLTFSFSGNQTLSFEDSEDSETRLYEAFFRWENKNSGGILTFGRQRMEPRAIAYRLDGLSYRWPTTSGVELGVYAGSSVESTRTDFFAADSYLFGVSATLAAGIAGPGALSGYLYEERTDDYTDRRVLGLEYDYDFENGAMFANAEYDVMFQEFNRILVSGTQVLPNSGRITARLAYYRSPTLSLENALIGQSATSIEELQTTLSNDEIEDLALDRTSKVTTFGLTYFGPINEDWDFSAYASLYDTSGTPATVGLPGADDVQAIEGDGVRTYVGFGVSGTSIFKLNDRLNLGLRYSRSDDDGLYVASSSLRYPISDKWLIRPRIRIGYRDEDDGGQEKFIVPSIYSRYKINRETELQFEVGGNWSKTESSTSIVRQRQYFVTAGVSRSF